MPRQSTRIKKGVKRMEDEEETPAPKVRIRACVPEVAKVLSKAPTRRFVSFFLSFFLSFFVCLFLSFFLFFFFSFFLSFISEY